MSVGCLSHPDLRRQCLWEGEATRLPSPLLLPSEHPSSMSVPLAHTGRLMQSRSTNKSDSLPESPLGPWELGRSRRSPGRGQFWGKGPELLHPGQREGSRDAAQWRVRQCPLKERARGPARGGAVPCRDHPRRGAVKATGRRVNPQMGSPPSPAVVKGVP